MKCDTNHWFVYSFSSQVMYSDNQWFSGFKISSFLKVFIKEFNFHNLKNLLLFAWSKSVVVFPYLIFSHIHFQVLKSCFFWIPDEIRCPTFHNQDSVTK